MSHVRCPKCNRFGSPALGGHCSNCVPKPNKEENHHISENQMADYPWSKDSFVSESDKCSLFKDKPDIVRGL